MKTYSIYKIINTENKLVYIGQTVQSLRKRFYDHQNPKSNCRRLREAMNEIGRDKFSIHFIASTSHRPTSNVLETFWIDAYESIENGYNIERSGYGKSEETCAKISASLKGSIPWNKGKECPQISEAMLGNTNGAGHIMTEDNKQALSERMTGTDYGKANKGRTFKPETIEKMSESAKQRPANRPKGSITSDATRKKQSEAAKGRIPWNKGLKVSKIKFNI